MQAPVCAIVILMRLPAARRCRHCMQCSMVPSLVRELPSAMLDDPVADELSGVGHRPLAEE